MSTESTAATAASPESNTADSSNGGPGSSDTPSKIQRDSSDTIMSVDTDTKVGAGGGEPSTASLPASASAPAPAPPEKKSSSTHLERLQQRLGASGAPGTSSTKKRKESDICKAEGCEKYRRANCDGYCMGCHIKHNPSPDVDVATKKVKKTKVLKEDEKEEGGSDKKKKKSNAKKSGTKKRQSTSSAKASTSTTPASKKAKTSAATHPKCTSANCNKYQQAKCNGLCLSCFKTKTGSLPSSSSQLCKLQGCDKFRQKSGGYCCSHADIGKRLLVAPILSSSSSKKKGNNGNAPNKSLKPQLKVGSKIYAAYWPTDTDPDREMEPDWYPGKISSYRVSQKPNDERYGYIRYYNVHYDDGDTLKNIEEHFVFSKEEYELHVRLGEEEEKSKKSKKGKGKSGWLGVKNVTDKKSKDQWAKHVGWYVATIDGEKHTCSLLADALRAYDAAMVNSKGLGTKKTELNLPEEWEDVFKAPVAAKEMTPDGKKKEVAKDKKSGKKEGAEEKRKHAKIPMPEGASNKKGKAATPGKTPPEASKPVAAVTEVKTTPVITPIAIKTKMGGKQWTLEDAQLIVVLDEYYSGEKNSTKYDRISEHLPNWERGYISKQVILLRKQIEHGKGIQEMFGLSEIKTTLSMWARGDIDKLIVLEDQHRDMDEDTKNKKIAEAIPRWGAEQCSFKTLFMRWKIRVLEETEEKKRKKAEAEEKKRKALAQRASAIEISKKIGPGAAEIEIAKKMASAVTASPMDTPDGIRHQPVTNIQPVAKSAGTPKAVTDATKAKEAPVTATNTEKSSPSKDVTAATLKKDNQVPAPHESKIDEHFVELLNNDPVLQKRCQPQTLEDLVKDKKSAKNDEQKFEGEEC